MADSKTVEVTILDQVRALKPTLRAAKLINSAFNGFQGAYERIQRGDSDALVMIVAAGLDLREQPVVKKLEEDMYETGFFSFIAPATEYVTLLANGGRNPNEVDMKGGDEKNG